MALTPEEEERRNALIQEGIRLSQQLNDTQQENSFRNFTGSLADAERLVRSLRDEWAEYTRDVAGTALNFQRIVGEVNRMTGGIKLTNSVFKSLTSMAQQLQNHQEGFNRLSSTEIKGLQKKIGIRKNELNLAKQLLEDQIQNNTTSAEDRARAQTALDNINSQLNDSNSRLNQFNTQLVEAAKEAKIVENALGLGGAAIKGMADSLTSLGLGGIADRLNLDEAKEAMEQMSLQLTENGTKVASLGDKFKILGAGAKAAFSGLGKKMLDPLLLIQQFTAALKATDDEAGKLAKGFNMTYSEALKTRRELGNMAAMSGDVVLNTKNLQETLMAVGQSLGSNAKLNEKDLQTFTKLREQAGYTNEQLASIQKLSLVNGKSLEQNTKEILGGAKAYASRKGLIINEKQILDDVATASATLKLSLGGSADELARSAVQARSVGLNLEQAAAMADSLLSFESSIENELSAELLLGKDLNFERARTLALNNDIAGAAEEIANQVGTSADFAKMNAIQQEAIAKAAGLTKEQLAQSLIDREALAKLSGVEGKDAKEKFNNLVKQVGMEEAKKRLGNEQLANQFQQQSVQERFAQAVEKLKEIFVQIAEPVLAFISPIANLVSTILPAVNMLLQPIVWSFQMISSIITTALEGAGKLLGIFTGTTKELGFWEAILGSLVIVYGAITAYSKLQAGYAAITAAAQSGIVKSLAMQGLSMLKNLGVAIATAVAQITGASAATLGVAAVIALAAGVAAYAFLSSKKGDDILSPPPGGNGYGKRTLFGPEGAIQLNDKDTIVATTNPIGKADDMMSTSKSTESFPKNSLSVSNKTTPTPPPPDNNALMLAEQKKQTQLAEERNRYAKRDNTTSIIKVQ